MNTARAKTSAGNHLLAIFQGPESYIRLKSALSDIQTQMAQTPSLKIGSETVNITYYLGVDYKFILTVLGLDGATSTYACAYCKVPKNERYLLGKGWSMSDGNHGARTISEMQTLCRISIVLTSQFPPAFPLTMW